MGRAAGRRVSPIIIRAYYGTGAHHPHLKGGTVGDWPLNVFDEEQAAAELPALRAVAAADLHNLVFQRDYPHHSGHCERMGTAGVSR